MGGTGTAGQEAWLAEVDVGTRKAYFQLSDLLLWACSQVNSARLSPPRLRSGQDKSSLSYAAWVTHLFTEMRQEANA